MNSRAESNPYVYSTNEPAEETFCSILTDDYLRTSACWASMPLRAQNVLVVTHVDTERCAGMWYT